MDMSILEERQLSILECIGSKTIGSWIRRYCNTGGCILCVHISEGVREYRDTRNAYICEESSFIQSDLGMLGFE